MSSTDHTFEAAVEASLATLPLGIEQSALPEQAGTMTYRDAHELAISKLAEEVAAAPAITDRKTREQVQRIRTRLVGIRTGLDKRRKDLFAPLRALKEQVDAYIGTGADGGLQARVKALERVLEDKEAVWDQEQERIRQEALRIVQERSAARWRELEALGFRFDGTAYWIGDFNHPLMLRRGKAEMDALNDEAWGIFLRAAKHNAAEISKERCADERFDALISAGMAQDSITGHATYTMLGGVEQIVTREYLHDCSEELYRQQLDLVHANEAALKRAKEEEHEAMRRRFAEQAERERKMDEERAELDRQRAAMREEKRAMRRDKLISIGAVPACVNDGDALVFGRRQVLTNLLADYNDAEWNGLVDAFMGEVEYVAEKRIVAERLNERGKTLVLRGAMPDETGTWTLGNATTTNKLLGEMDAEAWNACLSSFEDEEERIAAQSAQHLTVAETTTGHVDTAELLSCALALLDEANKCQTIACDDLDDDECEQMCVKVVAHASDCVKLVRELQDKRKP